jgi:PEP-CTERM motif
MTRIFRTIRSTMMGSIVVLAISSSIAQGSSILELIGADPSTFYDPSGGKLAPAVETEWSIHRAEWPSGGVSLAVHPTTGIVPAGADGIQTTSFFDVFYDGPAGSFPADSFFDIFVDITDPGTGKHLRMVQGGGINLPQVDVTTTKGLSTYQNTLTLDPAQAALSINGLQFVPGSTSDPNANSFFDIFVNLQFNGGPLDTSQPLFRLTTAGASVPEPSTLVLAAVGVATLMAVARKRRLRTL